MIVMKERTSTELYGIRSIRHMNIWNGIHAAVWGVSLVVGLIAVCLLVPAWHDSYGTVQSIQVFQRMLLLEGGYIVVLAGLWWFVTSSSWLRIAGLRSYAERHAKIFAVIFDVLAAMALILPPSMFLERFQIKLVSGHAHVLYCPLILPLIFVALMYAAPPVHIQEVVFPGKKKRRWLLAAVAIIIAASLLVHDFL